MKKPNTVQNQPLNSKNILSNLDKNKNDLKKLTKLIMVAISKTKETGAIVNSMAADVFKLLDSPSTGKQNTQIYKEQLHSMMRDQNKNIEYIGSLLTKFTLIENQIAEQEKCVERISSENIATQELELKLNQEDSDPQDVGKFFQIIIGTLGAIKQKNIEESKTEFLK